MFAVTTLFLTLIGQLPDNRELGEGNQPVDVKQIEYTITLNHAEYRPLQDIIVRSTIKNIGTSTLKVPEPSANALYVQFGIEQKTDEGLEVIEGFGDIAINPLWDAYLVTLAPGQSATLSSELFVGGAAGWDMGFDPGEYVFSARYYPDRTPRKDLKFVESNHVPFRVRPHTPEEEVEYRAILKARGDVNSRRIYDGASARAFLEKYPNSIYRSLAFGVLADGRYRAKDWKRIPEFQRLEREAMGCDTFTDLSYYSGATALLQAGDPEAAVKLLRETNLANSRAFREGLEAKYGPFPDPGPTPPPSPIPPATVAAPPRNTAWIWLVSGIVLGIASLILLRFYRQAHLQK